MHAESVHVCGVVVEYTTPTGRVNKGVATTWLKEKVPQAENLPKVGIYWNIGKKKQNSETK